MASTVKPFEFYTIGTVGRMKVMFPEDRVCCNNCELLTTDRLERPKCRLTNYLIFEPRLLSDICPLQFNGDVVKTRKDILNYE